MQGFFNQVQVVDPHAGRVALVALQRLTVAVEEVQGCADAQGFTDIACHGLLGRAIPLHPVERPHVPQVRVVYRCIGHSIVVGRDRVAEAGIGNPAKGIGAPRAFERRVKAAMGVVPGHGQKGVQRGLEVLAQLLVTGFIVVAQNRAGKALKFPGVVIRGCQACDQRLAKAAAAQGRYAGRQHVLRRATVNAQRLAFVTQLAGVAGRAGDVQILNGAAGVLMASEANGQVGRIGGAGLLLRVDQKAKPRQILRRSEALRREGQLKGTEPVVMQAFHLGALGRVVIKLPIRLAPLVLVVHVLRRGVSRQFWVGDEVDNHTQP